LIHYRDCEKRESFPHGRQDQHPNLFYLLDKIRVEYNNLNFFLSGKVFHHVNTVDSSNPHIRSNQINSSNAIFGVHNNHGFAYMTNNNSSPQLYNMDNINGSSSGAIYIKSEPNSAFEMENHNYLGDSTYSTNMLHETPQFYSPAFLPPPSMSSTIRGGSHLPASSMFLSSNNVAAANANDYDDSSAPMIDDADIQVRSPHNAQYIRFYTSTAISFC